MNRDLFHEFAALLAAAEWDIALLQEVPPRWDEPLAAATGSEHRRAMTARNWMRPLTFPFARRRPHLPGSWEGGSNLILVRRSRERSSARSRGGRRTATGRDRPGATIVETRSATLTRRPERRKVTMMRLAAGLCVANFHASTGKDAEVDVLRAADLVTTWADDAPLVFGGDFNVRPAGSAIFDRLEQEFGLTGATAADSIDHLLVRNTTVLEPATAWPPGRRDVPDPDSDRLIRLSDHAPITIRFSA